MPATAMLTTRSCSPCLSFTVLLSARSSASLRSSVIDGGFRLAPLGLPLWPGLNWYSLGGRPGPTLYSSADAVVIETLRRVRRLCRLFCDGWESSGVVGRGLNFAMLLLPLARTSRRRARGGRNAPRACDFVEAPELAGCHREFGGRSESSQYQP